MPLSPIDPLLFQALHIDPLANPAVEWIAEQTATWGIAAVPFVLLALWLSGERVSRLAGVSAGMTSILALTLAGVMSWSHYEPRPFADGLSSNVLQHVADSSFPSDHATLMAAAAFGLLFGRRRGAALVLLFATAAVGWSRVALGIHYPSDVLAGVALGCACALLFRLRLPTRLSGFATRIAEGLAGSLSFDTLPERRHHLRNKER